MPERAVRAAEKIGGFGLHAVRAVLRSRLQQGALDAGDVAFHANSLGKDCTGGNLRDTSTAYASRGRSRFGAFRGQLHV